jgi:hypothetical protein
MKKYGCTSIKFDGAGDYLELPDESDWSFGTGDFTIENFSILPRRYKSRKWNYRRLKKRSNRAMMEQLKIWRINSNKKLRMYESGDRWCFSLEVTNA